MISFGVLGATLLIPAASLENGLALTPPMGWLSWQRFGCAVDAKLVKRTADAMKRRGLLDAGYKYVNIDDCWSLPKRVGGKLIPDPAKFPRADDSDDGMKSLSKYLHEAGFLFGTYSDMGARTCGRYPGLLELKGYTPATDGDDVSAANGATAKSYKSKKGSAKDWLESATYLVEDLKQFVEWEVDALKVDGCGTSVSHMYDLYSALSDELMAHTPEDRRILLSCSWPAYAKDHSENDRDMRALREKCNLWRNYWDINDSWETVKGITKFFARKDPNDIMVAAAGPGHWNDPDMLVIGTPGLSVSEQRAQFALWAILAAPLYISVDVETMPQESVDILVNKKVIAVNQDPLGKQGFVLWENDPKNPTQRIWVRRLKSDNPGTKYAVLFANNDHAFGPSDFSLSVAQLGWTPSAEAQYIVDNLHRSAEEAVKTLPSAETFKVSVDVSSVEMFTFEWIGDLKNVDANKFPQDRFEKNEAPKKATRTARVTQGFIGLFGNVDFN